VHQEVPELAHFDITSLVKDDQGRPIGLVFASFSLELVRARLQLLHRDNAYLQVTGPRGELIAEYGQTPSAHTEWLVQLMNIPNSDWTLRLSRPEVSLSPLLMGTVLASIALFALLGLLLTTFALRLGRIISDDVVGLHESIRLMRDDNEVRTRLQPQLEETGAIMHNICDLLDEVDEYQQRLAMSSITDELTGLLNRRGFMQRAAQAQELGARGVPHSLLLLDLDNFKRCNDTYGHGHGDQVLQAFAKALLRRARRTDVIARIGGDEFAVILASDSGIALQSWFNDVVQAFRSQQLAMPNNTGMVNLCGCSAGAVELGIGQSLDDLFLLADARLYRAKSSGRGGLIEE